MVRSLQTRYSLEFGAFWWSEDRIFQGYGWNGPPVWIDGLDTDTVSRQKVGRGINAESGEGCDLAEAHYKWGAVYRITKDLDYY